MDNSSVYDKLTGYLSGREIIKEVKISSRIISWLTPFDFAVFNLDSFLKTEKNIFYLSKPAEGTKILAAGQLLSVTENGNGRFHATDKKIRSLREKILANWNDSEIPVPLFTGGMKFTVEHNDPDWKDFSDSTWYIPETIFFTYQGADYLIHNFYYTRTSDPLEIASTLKEKISRLAVSYPETALPLVTGITGQSPKDKKKWKTTVSRAIEKIHDGSVDKVVVSRRVELNLSNPPAFHHIIKKFEFDYPGCAVFLLKSGNSVFFGASPEKLLVIDNNKFTIDALAGSAGNGQNLFSEKNLREHDHVLEFIKTTIAPFADNLQLTRFHDTKKLNNISHIWSEISAEMKNGTSVFPVLKEIFPTPAVCGTPKDAALSLIKKLEEHRRGLYAGNIGWFNFSDAEFYVSIRSALNLGRKILGYAGCGIVDGSDADDEFIETGMKLIPVLSLFNHENKNQPQYSLG